MLYLALLIDEDFQTMDTGSLCGSAVDLPLPDARSQDLRVEKPRRGNKLPQQRVWLGPGERTVERGRRTCHRKGRSDQQRQPRSRSANEIPAESTAERTDSFRIGQPPDRHN